MTNNLDQLLRLFRFFISSILLICFFATQCFGVKLLPKDPTSDYDARIATFNYVGHSIGKVKFELAVTNVGIGWGDGQVELTYKSFDWSKQRKEWVSRASAAGRDPVPALPYKDPNTNKIEKTAQFLSNQTFRTRWIRPDAWSASLFGGDKRIADDKDIYDRTGIELRAKFTSKFLNAEFKSDEGEEPINADVPKEPVKAGSKLSVSIKNFIVGKDPHYSVNAIPADDAHPTGMGEFLGIDEEILAQVDYIVDPSVYVFGAADPLSKPLYGRTTSEAEYEYVPMSFDFDFGNIIDATDDTDPPELLFDINIPDDAKLGTYLFRLMFTPEITPASTDFPGHFPGFVGVDTVWGSFTVVPEPSTMLLLSSGLVGLLWYNRKWQKT